MKLNIQYFADGKVILDLDLNTKGFDLEIEATKDKLDKLIEEYLALEKADPFEGQEKELFDYQTQIEKTRNKYVELKSKQDELNKKGFGNIEESIANVGTKLNGVIKKVAKWSLAVIGVRSAYLGIRSAINTLSETDDTLKANIEYIRWALANAIKPIIEWIIKAINFILGIVGGIIKVLTGKNIFDKSGVKDFQKAMSKSSKSAKEIKKELAGFDEMNVLSDNTPNNIDNGIGTPDLGSIGDNVDDWAKKIEKFFDKLVDNWFKAGKKLKDVLNDDKAFKDAYGVWDKFVQGIVRVVYGAWEIITGIVEMLGGLWDMIVGLFTGNLGLLWEGFKIFISGIWDLIKGLFQFIAGIGEIVFGLIKGLLAELWSGIQGLFFALINALKSLLNFIEELISPIVSWVNDKVIKPIENAIKKLWDGLKNGAKSAWEGTKEVFSKVATFFKDTFKNAWEGVKKVFSVGGKIFDGIKEGIVEAFKTIVNAIITGINKVVSVPFEGINWALRKIHDIEILGKHPFSWIGEISVPEIPRLAKGGIINYPGRGVAIGGEHGPEAVVPLTDSQQMAILGEAIGKYITINASITNTMNGRVISKELQKINSENDFAYNR